MKQRPELLLLPDYNPYDDCKDCHYDEIAGNEPVDFIQEYLTHVKGDKAGELVILEDWQKCLIRNLFGWKRPDGTRRYRELFLYIPRKNGKSFLSAAILIYIMFCDGEKGAEIYTAALNWEQARLVFEATKGMIRQDEELNEKCEILGKSIRLKSDPNFVFVPLTGATEGKHGLNIHVTAVDELHEHSNWDLVEPLVSAMGSRKQPLTIIMTTADFNRVSPCNEQLKLAKDIRSGVKNDYTFLPVVYEIEKDAAWDDPDNWAKANPNLGVSVYESYLETQAIKAKNQPSYLNTFKRLYLNIQTDAENSWIPLEQWRACTTGKDYQDLSNKRLEKIMEKLKDQECFGGFDLASNRDFTAFVLFFPKLKIALSFFYLPEEYKLKYAEQEWLRSGHILLTPGNTTDEDFVFNHVNKLASIYDIKGIAYDKFGARSIADKLIKEGFDMVEFG